MEVYLKLNNDRIQAAMEPSNFWISFMDILLKFGNCKEREGHTIKMHGWRHLNALFTFIRAPESSSTRYLEFSLKPRTMKFCMAVSV